MNQRTMKGILFLVFLALFVITTLVTLSGLIGWVRISDGYLESLVTAFLLQSAAAIIATFKGAKFFEIIKHPTLDDYTPEGDALRFLATLWHYQQQNFPNGGPGRWVFAIPPQSPDFPAYLAGHAELVSYRLVEVNPQNWMCGLSTLGLQMCPKWNRRFGRAHKFIVA